MQKILILLLSLFAGGAQASSSVSRHEVEAPIDQVYELLYQALESKRLWVVFEPNLGRSIGGMAERLGENYNRNRLQGIRSLVTCNAWYANEVSNLDPDMLALCPLRVSVIHKDGMTRVLFARPTLHAQESAALPVLEEIEELVIEAIRSAVQQAATQS